MSYLTTSDPLSFMRYRWTAHDFHWLFVEGFLAPEGQFELIEGDIWVKPFQQPANATAISLCLGKLKELLPKNFWIRTQQPLLLGEFNRPEPDISVVTGAPRDYLASHPTTAELVVEISDATLRADQTTKAALYARAEIAEYWIVNLVEHRLEVRRQPSPLEGELLGHGYRFTQILLPGESIAPLGAATAPIGVDELLP